MINSIFKGIKAYTNSLALISKLKLWRYFFVPMLISILTAILIGVFAYGLSDTIGGFFSELWLWDWGKQTVTAIARVMGGVLIIALGFILYKHIVMALSAPFMSPVSEKIEAYFTETKITHTHRNTDFKAQLWRGIRINVRNLIMELALTIPIILLGLIPVVGLVSSFLLFLVQAYYAGFGNMDYTLERHFKYSKSIDFVRKNRGLAIGNGLVFMLFLLVPVLGVILVLPLSVTASTIETVKVLQKDALMSKHKLV